MKPTFLHLYPSCILFILFSTLLQYQISSSRKQRAHERATNRNSRRVFSLYETNFSRFTLNTEVPTSPEKLLEPLFSPSHPPRSPRHPRLSRRLVGCTRVVRLTRPREPRSTHGTPLELVQNPSRLKGSEVRVVAASIRPSIGAGCRVPSRSVTIGDAISREMEHAGRLYSSEVEVRPPSELYSLGSLASWIMLPFVALLSNGKHRVERRPRVIQLKINQPRNYSLKPEPHGERDTSIVRSPLHQFATDYSEIAGITVLYRRFLSH